MMPSHDPECQNASRYHVHPVNRSVQSVDMAKQSSHKNACVGGYVSHGREAQGLLLQDSQKHFSLPSLPLALFYPREWRVCPHLCWDNVLVYLVFPALYALI